MPDFVEIRIEFGNDAFADAPETELGRILRELADDIESGAAGEYCVLQDVNGNTVGHFEIVPEQ